jgi:hypothetical protein
MARMSLGAQRNGFTAEFHAQKTELQYASSKLDAFIRCILWKFAVFADYMFSVV